MEEDLCLGEPIGEPTQKRARCRQTNLRSLSQSEEVVPSYLSKFLQQLNDSLNNFKTSLIDEIKSVLNESVSKPIVEKISCRIEKVVSDSVRNVVPTANQKETYAQVVAANIDLQRYPEKSSQAVICNISESDDPKTTEETDRAALKTLFQATSLKKKFENGEIKWFRHPKEKPRDSKGRGRPIKVKLPSQQDQVTFIREAEKIRHTTFVDQPHVFVRRDYTPRELDIDRDLRKECGKRNKECGLIKFVVRDLEIYEIKKPRHKVLNENCDIAVVSQNKNAASIN